METSAQKRTVRHIISTSYQLLEHHYFDSVTVQQICQEAEINRSTFYRYFEDKNDLLYHIMQYIGELLFGTKHIHQKRNAIESLFHYIDDHRSTFRHLLLSSKQEDVFRDFQQIISNEMFEGAFAKTDCEEHEDELAAHIRESRFPHLICDVKSMMLVEVLRQWLVHKYEFTPKELIKFIEEEL
ncbi:TetR/AcrR family transcriptional regulator [Staphylococcus sp. Marseille-Q5304]|uniref:TetR/AcrR family transcriptional regulator n=1 Tax=Staphylococcus sp. Marseille-Q5304 TaxID=2942200 RepID=UPI002073B610|nr:TetR/AcrR family transcriptional regulator [Staphylococcus sp. Marseille-Q5304]